MINLEILNLEILIDCKTQQDFLNFIEKAVKGNDTVSCLHFRVESYNYGNSYKIFFTIYDLRQEELIRSLAAKYSKEYN